MTEPTCFIDLDDLAVNSNFQFVQFVWCHLLAEENASVAGKVFRLDGDLRRSKVAQDGLPGNDNFTVVIGR